MTGPHDPLIDTGLLTKALRRDMAGLRRRRADPAYGVTIAKAQAATAREIDHILRRAEAHKRAVIREAKAL